MLTETQYIEKRHSLAPIKLDEGNPAYKSVEELAHAISLPECKNIALTGVYGSGKSSIIDTYLSLKQAPKRVLRISLSNFLDNAKGKGTDGNEYENEIEFKLFQHIIYKANADTTQRSQYKRLHEPNYNKLGHIALLIALFFLCFIIVFEPKFLQIDAFYRVFELIFKSWSSWVNTIFDIIASIVMAWMLFKAIKHIVVKSTFLNIKSLKAKEIEINFKEDKSVLNKLLNEILYYFNAGGYELVVFEDLDRISDPQHLFLKLREINVLLNESDDFVVNGKSIKFLYAIRDDVFPKGIRTKSFDYLIPVIPVVNSFNAGEYILINYKQEVADINDADVKRLGMYITSIRDLTNIMNEFMLYRSTILKDSMSAKKLLAITIYKNLFPGDYSKIHTKGGCLYRAFSDKHHFTDPLTKEMKETVANCQEKIKNEHDAIKKCRMNILDWLYNEENISELIINGIAYSLEEIARVDTLFDKFKHDKIESWVIDAGPNSEAGTYDYKYKDILSSADPDNTFEEIVGDHEYSVRKESEKKRELEKKINSIEGKTLCELMKLSGDGNVSKDLLSNTIEGEDCKDDILNVLHSLIRGGYISDDYTTYISYTYTGSFDEQEFNFQQSVMQGIPLDYSYKLQHIEAFIDTLYSDNFESRCILNNDLLVYLLNSKKVTYLDNFIVTARKYPDFVVQFDALNGNEKFLRLLFKDWNECVKYISGIQDNDIRSSMLHLFYKTAPTDFLFTTEEREFISTQYKFIADGYVNYDKRKLNDFLRDNHIVFKELVQPNDITKPLFDYIVSHDQFEVNYTNLRVIYGSDFDTKSYTTIIDGGSELQDYVSKDISALVQMFPETDVDESQEAIVLLSNIKKINNDVFESLLVRQNCILPNFEKVSTERIPLFFKCDKIEAIWENVKMYFASSDNPDGIVPFIVNHVNDLKGTKINEDEDKQLQLFLMDNKTLPIEVFKELLPSCGYYFEASEIGEFDEERLSVVLDQDYVEYSQETKELYSVKSPELWGRFLVYFFEEFKNDESFGVNIPNESAIYILKSSLTLVQKKYYIDHLLCILNGTGLNELSNLVCFYYQQVAVNDETNVKILIKAMENSNEDTTWKQKIDLVNRINSHFPYRESTEVDLLHALGGGYLSLSSYRGVSHFDNNNENRVLLEYLLNHGHYINKIKEEDGGLKVTFKNPPSDI